MADQLSLLEFNTPACLDPPPTADAPVAAAPSGLDATLYGGGTTERIVAVEVVDQTAVLFRRIGGQVVREEHPFTAWLLATEQRPYSGATWSELPGGGYRWRADFAHWRGADQAREDLRIGGVGVIGYGSTVRQYLTASGQTLFKGMRFEELLRMQVDLETTTLDPRAPEARILLIAATDSEGREWVFYEADERALLEAFLACLRETDPDVIEGHNLFGFDLPYLAARAEALGLALAMGRDGSGVRFGRERNCPVGPIQVPFRPAHIWGRHCIDTLLAAQRFDIGRGELESYGLKECARVYGLAEADRVILDRARMAQLWQEDPELVRRYALQDVRETRRLAELTTPTEFYQTQMLPDSYQNVAVTGTGEKVNSLMVREYLRRGHAVPQAQRPRPYAGGYTEVRRTGVLRGVVKADVESLYPSIMLRDGLRPAADTLDVFLPMLRHLTERRLEAKAAMRGAEGAQRQYWNGLQSSFKVVINSFYGYLGGPFYFNDYDAAERVTLTGQAIARQLADLLKETGSEVIEIDTDGVYFVPPQGVEGEAAEQAYVERLASRLPEGIRLAYDGRYAAMVSLKIKNYVLLDYQGNKVFKGAAVRSRADERFGRDFIARAVDYLIAGDLEGLQRDYLRLGEQIRRGELPVEQLARRERITTKTFSSEGKKRSREAVGARKVGESVLLYERNDGTLALIEEYAGDEDRWHYLEKLRRFASRLEDAIGADFDRLCPKNSRQQMDAERAGQGALFEL